MALSGPRLCRCEQSEGLETGRVSSGWAQSHYRFPTSESRRVTQGQRDGTQEAEAGRCDVALTRVTEDLGALQKARK